MRRGEFCLRLRALVLLVVVAGLLTGSASASARQEGEPGSTGLQGALHELGEALGFLNGGMPETGDRSD